jgi:hypothetical protein
MPAANRRRAPAAATAARRLTAALRKSRYANYNR